MTKYNIGDRVLVADPAYLVFAEDAAGYVSSEMFGKTGTITEVPQEDSDGLVGQAYAVEADSGLWQTISQRYLSPAPEPVKPTTIFDDLEDGIYEVDDTDTFIVRGGEATFARCRYALSDDWYSHDPAQATGRVVRLVQPEIEPSPDYPEDGAYVDTDNDLLVIADRKATWVVNFGKNGQELDHYELASYGPFIPLVPEAK